GSAFSGSGELGVFEVTTSSTFAIRAPATITVSQVSFGPSSTQRTVLTAAEMGLSVVLTASAPAPTTGTAEVRGQVEEATGDAAVVGEIEEDTGDAQITGQVQD
ncbi:MAG: hypothetical protein KKB50_19845, partial [Planctomycetes bacterium]|nr:hypothetical protein [Planctomycetota bacterium]